MNYDMTILPDLRSVRSVFFRAQPSALLGARARIQGATLVEFVIVAPLLLFISLILIQYTLLFHTRSMLNYALFEGARSGSVSNADPAAIETAFTRAMTGYHGGGRNTAELADAHQRAENERSFVRIEILSPNRSHFDDLHSPELARQLGISRRVIPNDNLAFLYCPIDRPGCNAYAGSSAPSLVNANLLQLRVTYGIPPRKQIPLAGRFMNAALAFSNAADGDAFKHMLINDRRIPVVTEVTMRMQSPAIESPAAADPDEAEPGLPGITGLPLCPITQPACTTDDTLPDEDKTGTNSTADEDSGAEEASNQDETCHPLFDPGCGALEHCEAPTGWLAGGTP